MGQIKRSGDPQRGDGAVDQLWNGRLPTIGDGAHIDHQGAGVEQVVISVSYTHLKKTQLNVELRFFHAYLLDVVGG